MAHSPSGRSRQPCGNPSTCPHTLSNPQHSSSATRPEYAGKPLLTDQPPIECGTSASTASDSRENTPQIKADTAQTSAVEWHRVPGACLQ
jgi:hypothetical protein